MGDHEMDMRSILAIANTTHGRGFCVTARGYAGLVPETAQVGDSMAVIMDAQTPFVIRKA
jgi:hypothetical protein